jgi:hypothetical protein
MTAPIWIGIISTVFALIFIGNGIRLTRGPRGHAHNAGRLHTIVAAIFLPIIWVVVLQAAA